jgi:uncharacterized protein YuzE
MNIAYSVNGVPIRLSYERWYAESREKCGSGEVAGRGLSRGNQTRWICNHRLSSIEEAQRRSHMATVAPKKTADFVSNCIAAATKIMKLPARHVWLDYDKEADVLYMSFRKPQRAKETIELEDDILLRKDGKEIVGLTILNASSK